MDKTPVYIKRILALLILVATGYFLSRIVSFIYVIPFCFFTLAFLISRITGEKPYYLYGMGEADKYLDSKGGFWLLFKWVFGIFGLLYDILAMTLNGVFQLFLIFTDILLLIKTILYWIIHAIIWFLKLFLPPLVFLYKTSVYYLIKWPWWIYKLTFRNAGPSINKNYYRLTYPASFISLMMFFIFLGAALFTGIKALTLPGIIFALVPLAWSEGAVSFTRRNNLSESGFDKVCQSFNSGYDTVRAMLFYLSLTLLFLLSEILLNLLGWIPVVGFSLLGISLNFNTLITTLILFLGVILLFANMILPAHVIALNNPSAGFNESIRFIGVIGRKFLRYLSSLIPAAFFSLFLLIVPAFILFLAVTLSLNLKNNILDTRIEILKEKELYYPEEQKANVKKNIKLLRFYKGFPENTLTEFAGIRELKIQTANLEENLLRAQHDISSMEAQFTDVADSLKNVIQIMGPLAGDLLVRLEMERLNASLETKKASFESWKSLKIILITEIKAEISYLKTITYQLPVVFFFTAIWISLFGGILLTVLVSYLGNVFHELYSFREDGNGSYFYQLARYLNKKDPNQPLLGFTLWGLLALILVYFFSTTNFFN